MLAVAILLTTVGIAGIASLVVGNQRRVATPVTIFLLIEIFAVLVPLWPSPGSPIQSRQPLIMVAVATLLFAVFYRLVADRVGIRSSLTRFRGSVSALSFGRTQRRAMAALVGALCALGLWTFQGPPPLLTGFGALLRPDAASDSVATIRELRRATTKGHVFGDSYSGQGLINAFTEVSWRYVITLAVASYLVSTGARQKRSGRSLWLVGALGFIFLGSTGVRSSLLLVLAAVGVCASLLKRWEIRRVAMLGCAAICLALLISPLSKGASGGVTPVERASALMQRVTDGNGANNAKIIDLVESGHLEVSHGGLMLERAQAALPGTPSGTPFAFRVTEATLGAGENRTGYSTPTQLGLLFADFRWPGVFVGYALSGVFIALGTKWALTRRATVTGVAFVANVFVALGYWSVTGVHGVVVSVLLLMALQLVFRLAASFVKPQAPSAAVASVAISAPS